MSQDNDFQVSIVPSDWIIGEKPMIALSEKDILKIDCKIDKHVYLVYKEKTPNFNKPPKDSNIKLNPGKTYKFEYNVDIQKGASANLYFIGYSDDEKIQTEIILPKDFRKITIDPRCTKYRLAIRLSGYGYFSLENIKISLYDETRIISKQKQTNINIRDIKNLKIAAIVDSFTELNLSKECNLITFTQNNWLEIFQKENPHIFFVESAWHGNNDTWQYKIGKYNNQDKSSLYDLIEYCNQNSIPTVFWNKEDPVHFEKFIDSTKLFDYIFTTDRNMIKKYKDITNNENVYELPFAAQPKLHNPIKNYDRIDGICFAGSYYGDRHKERLNDIEEILDICKDYNLIIYDRNYEINKSNPNSQTIFPERFKDNIQGSLEYSEIDKAYKGYKLILNVNSVKYSPTMFSRRVFEGLACGTPIVSSYSQGIKEMFKDIVICDEDNKKIKDTLNILFNNDIFWKERSLKGIREVMLRHTYSDRFIYILSKMNIVIKKDMPFVTCFIFVNSLIEVEEAIKVFESQKYINKKLIIIMESYFKGYIEALNRYNTENILCFIGSYLRENYTKIKELVDSEYVSYINLENKYGENYLLDLIIGSMYTEAKTIGKYSYYSIDKENIKSAPLINNEDEYIYVDNMKSDRCIINIDVFEKNDIITIFDILKNVQYIENKCNNSSFYKIAKIVNKFKKTEKKEFHMETEYQIFSIDNNNFIELGKTYSNQDELNKIFM